MRKVFKITVVLFVLGSLCLSCHKYAEDPFISLRRPAKRIEGTWNITSYQIYGKEHSHDFDSLLSPKTLTDCYINFTSYGNFNYNANNGTSGAWAFVDKNNNAIFPRSNLGDNKYTFDSLDNLLLGYLPSPDSTFLNLFLWGCKNYPPPTIWPYEWKIVELYDKHFHISKNGTDIYFKKQ